MGLDVFHFWLAQNALVCLEVVRPLLNQHKKILEKGPGITADFLFCERWGNANHSSRINSTFHRLRIHNRSGFSFYVYLNYFTAARARLPGRPGNSRRIHASALKFLYLKVHIANNGDICSCRKNRVAG
jgi:hypothetical protein